MKNRKSIKDMIDLGFEVSLGDDCGCWGFYDWFCKDTSLKNKAKRLFSIATSLSKNTDKFDIEKCYFFFKNNCPCFGGLYDDIRICNIDDGEVLFNICPKYTNGKTMVYFKGHGFEYDTDGIEFNNVVEMKKWFKKTT